MFVSHTPHLARRYIAVEAESDRPGSNVVRLVPVRAGGHVFGLGDAPERYDPRPRQSLVAPLRPGRYFGVVDDVADEFVHATVRETPNGREMFVELPSPGTSACWSGPQPPARGDYVDIHTWTELPEGSPEVRERMHVEVHRIPLTDDEVGSLEGAIRLMEQPKEHDHDPGNGG